MKKTYELTPQNQASWDELTSDLTTLESYSIKVTVEVSKRRTGKQRSAIEVFCRELAKLLNDAGLDRVKALKILRKSPHIEIPWNQDSVKEDLWRPVQRVVSDKESSADLETDEVSKVYEVLNRHLANQLGVSLPFPSNRG